MFKAGSATGCCWDPFQDAFLGPETARAFHSFGWPELIDYDASSWNRISLVGNAREARFPLLIQQSDDEFRGAVASVTALQQAGKRSDEHTSELQSLMRISYAVFCLKKK